MENSPTSQRMTAKCSFLLLLLAGSEAYRIREQVQLSSLGYSNVTGPEDDWTAENNKCEWHISGWECGSTTKAALPDGSCQSRCMPLDMSWSSCCRLSDDYMLAHERATYFQISSGVLAAKASKFKKHCKASNNLWCQRRSIHLMRSIEFMSKAQDDVLLASMSDAEQNEQKRLFDKSLESMSDAMGEEGPILMKLQQKMKNDKNGVRGDPKGKITKIMSLVEMILKGTDEEKEAARKEIEAMPDHTDAAVGEEKVKQDDALETLAANLKAEQSATSTLLDATNYIEESVSKDGSSGSLLETDSNGSLALQYTSGLVNTVGFIVIVILIVAAVLWAVAGIISAIITWAFLSILGCGIYSLGHNAAVASNGAGAKIGVGGTLSCMGKVFAAPFIFIGTAVSAAYNFIFRNGRQSLLELSDTNLVELSSDARKRARILLLAPPPHNITA